jgi:hypothetical protein
LAAPFAAQAQTGWQCGPYDDDGEILYYYCGSEAFYDGYNMDGDSFTWDWYDDGNAVYVSAAMEAPDGQWLDQGGLEPLGQPCDPAEDMEWADAEVQYSLYLPEPGTWAISGDHQYGVWTDEEGWMWIDMGGDYGSANAPSLLSCTPTAVTRGGTVTCSLTTVPGGTQWSFTDSTWGYTVSGPSGVAQWSGTMVIGGRIQVAFTGATSQTVAITVNSRSGFATPAASAAAGPSQNGTQPTGCSVALSVPDPPQSGNSPLGEECPGLPAPQWQWATLSSGPNQGYTYLTSLTYSEAFYYTITPQLLNTGSAFYTAQCGNYNAISNPNGYISGSLLQTNVTQHENGTPGHYGQYVQAQGDAANNVGIVAEAVITAPGQSFNQAATAATDNAQTNIATATNSDTLLCGGNATEVAPACTFNGYVNYSPYAACH